MSEPLTHPIGPETSEVRSRWMTHFALASSVWFIIVILAMEVPVVVLRTCQ